jgi:arginine-tRNA-protein transferase
MVYSFFDPTLKRRSLGRFAILDPVSQATTVGLPYVYLGYWVRGSRKMDYKAAFRPLEQLTRFGWEPLA